MTSIHSLLNGQHKLSQEMRNYIATPWCQCQGEYKSCTDCQPQLKTINKQGIQEHGGDLFQHSQWSALYLTMWYKDEATKYKELHKLLVAVIKSELLNDIISTDLAIKLEFLQLCGFMHDICKGGDGIYDMYAKGKYGRKLTDADHPKVCKETLLNPKHRYAGLLKKTLDDQLERYKDKEKALAILALCAAVHWNFGKLNMPPERGGWTPKQYIDSINAAKNDIKIKLTDPDHILIKLCMAVGCADVASSYNDELLAVKPKVFNGIQIAKKTHLSSGGAWIKYMFNVKHKIYIKNVLKHLDNAKKPKQKTRKYKMRTRKQRSRRSTPN